MRHDTPQDPLVRVCAYCEAVRIVWPDGTERWIRTEPGAWPGMKRSHGICPRCFDAVVAELRGTRTLPGHAAGARG